MTIIMTISISISISISITCELVNGLGGHAGVGQDQGRYERGPTYEAGPLGVVLMALS